MFRGVSWEKKGLGERRGLDRRLRKGDDLFEVFWLEKDFGGVVKGFCSWWPAAQRLGRRLCAKAA